VGVSPLFPPLYPDDAHAQEALLDVVHHDPRLYGEERSRWTLAAFRRSCPWLHIATLAGVWGLLHRLDIRLKRAREHVHSPDLDYIMKVRSVQICFQRSLPSSSAAVVLFQDEMAYYRQPTVSTAYEQQGRAQALAERSWRSNSEWHVVATLNALTGQVVYHQASHITIPTLVGFYKTVHETYRGSGTIYVVQDNWPVHFHPDILAALEPQWFPWPSHVPGNWKETPRRTAQHLNLPIQLIALPTYAPWTNPIEKLWRWLRQDVLHLHRYADRWDDLKGRVAEFLDGFRNGSPKLLHYVGLTANSRLYGEFFRSPPVHYGLRR
jgi:hypothetical protein